MSSSPCQICGCQGTKKCGKCKHAYYCSSACQTSDWPNHKAECKIIRTLESELSEVVSESLTILSYAKTVVMYADMDDAHDTLHKMGFARDEAILLKCKEALESPLAAALISDLRNGTPSLECASRYVDIVIDEITKVCTIKNRMRQYLFKTTSLMIQDEQTKIEKEELVSIKSSFLSLKLLESQAF